MIAKEMICIRCPMGCALVAAQEDGHVRVTGNACARGVEYGAQELMNPVRTVTSSVRVRGGMRPLCPVKTADAVPKAAIGEVLAAIRQLRPSAPVRIGQVLIEGVAGTGVDLVATGSVVEAV